MQNGTLVGHFELREQIGAGGMGVVFRAHDRILHRDVALKLVHPDRDTPDFHRRFLDEARIAATLTHPGIAAIYEAGESSLTEGGPAHLYAAQELVSGDTLSALLARGPVPAGEAVDLVRQLLDALAHAHARGVVHRDIKPSNLMVTADGRLKVLDFGIARRVATASETTRLTAAAAGIGTLPEGGTIVGTPSYMAPEQLRGHADARTDLFAAGCVLFELLTGRRLLDTVQPSPAGAGRVAARVRDLRPEVPGPLAAKIDRAVAFDPADRFADAAAMNDALTDASTSRAQAVRAARRARVLAVAASVALVLLLGAGVWYWSMPALAFAERDWVLVGSVDNATGDPTFDAALENALETDLRQSQYVNVFDGAQLASALAMMRLTSDAPIDLETGRTICELAGLRVLLIPRIVSVGDAYQLEASLIEPRSGRVVDRLRVTARSREEVLLRGVDDFTRLVRQRLGESLPSIQKTDPALIEYATPSWDALRLVRLGGQALADSDTPRAARAFEQALEHDPTYPAALASLGLLYIEFLNRAAEGRKLLDAAATHSSPAAEREHLVLRALHKQFVTDDLAGALEDYRFVSSLYPDLFQPYNNSGRILIRLARYEEAVAMFEKAHARDPRHAVPLWNLWDLQLNRLGKPAAAEAHAETLATLQPDNAWVRHVTAWTHVARRRFDAGEQGMRDVLAALPLHPLARPNLGHLLFSRGAAAEAAAIYEALLADAAQNVVRISGPDVTLHLALSLAADGRHAEARGVLDREIARLTAGQRQQGNEYEDVQLAALLAAAGESARAEAILARTASSRAQNPWVLYLAARVRALLGHADAAADLLRQAVAAGYDQPYLALIDPALAALRDHAVMAEIAPE
jgi:tetratricopeptide (TPR) repeat protein